MELSQALVAIKQQISQGDLEEGYEQLVKLLDAYAHYAELAEIARVNQADLYQLKSQTLKGTIDPDDARLATNQLTDKALQIIRQLETGKVLFPEDIKPTSSKAWRYYIAGGIVTLALAAVVWWFLGAAEDDCPAFSKTAELKVMILPFKQTGKEKGQVEPETDIMDGLNDLIDKTSGLRERAIADVDENFDIDKDYPNSAQAVEIAQHCGAQMLVWGKVNQSGVNDYTVDVRYRLLDAGGVRYAGDTTISRLLEVTKEASWTTDVKAITRLLYMVLANQMRVPIAADVLREMAPLTTAALSPDTVPAMVDTSTSLVLADYHIRNKNYDAAIAEYDKVLEYDPANATARTKRGALLFQKEDYSGAARDLEVVKTEDQKTANAIQKTRIQALLKSNQPEKANREVQSALRDKHMDGAWLDQAKREIQDSTRALQRRRDLLEQQVTRTHAMDARVGAAKANLGLGETAEALRYAKDALKTDPKNLEAVKVAVEAHLQSGDTVSAAKTIKTAERAGANVKAIPFEPIKKRIPLTDKQQ